MHVLCRNRSTAWSCFWRLCFKSGSNSLWNYKLCHVFTSGYWMWHYLHNLLLIKPLRVYPFITFYLYSVLPAFKKKKKKIWMSANRSSKISWGLQKLFLSIKKKSAILMLKKERKTMRLFNQILIAPWEENIARKVREWNKQNLKPKPMTFKIKG